MLWLAIVRLFIFAQAHAACLPFGPDVPRRLHYSPPPSKSTLWGQSSPITWEKHAYGHWWLALGTKNSTISFAAESHCASHCFRHVLATQVNEASRERGGDAQQRIETGRGRTTTEPVAGYLRKIPCLPRSGGGVGWKRVPTFYKIASLPSDFNYEINIQIYSHGDDSGSRCVFVVVSEKMGQRGTWNFWARGYWRWRAENIVLIYS